MNVSPNQFSWCRFSFENGRIGVIGEENFLKLAWRCGHPGCLIAIMKKAVLPIGLLAALRKAGLVRKIWRTEDAHGLPRGPGAYMLFIQIEAPVKVVYNRRTGALEPGWYVYAGSANGPGGLGARIRRHFNEGKSVRWYVDHLTTKGKLWAMAVPGGAECPLVSALEQSGKFSHPLEGFGSSDCAKCTSHLLAFSG